MIKKNNIYSIHAHLPSRTLLTHPTTHSSAAVPECAFDILGVAVGANLHTRAGSNKYIIQAGLLLLTCSRYISYRLNPLAFTKKNRTQKSCVTYSHKYCGGGGVGLNNHKPRFVRGSFALQCFCAVQFSFGI